MIFNLSNASGSSGSSGTYVYTCNGVDDNVKISEIIREYLSSGTDYDSMRLLIEGNIGVTSYINGTGSFNAPFEWFDFNIQSNKRIILDFFNCSQLTIPIVSGKYNTIFNMKYSISVVGLNLIANNTDIDTSVRVIEPSGGEVYFERCRFWINTYKDSFISNRGNFINCRASLTVINSDSFCFRPNNLDLIRVTGGEYYAYTGLNTAKSAIVKVSGSSSVAILMGVNAPYVSRSGFYQTNAILQESGGNYVNCTDLMANNMRVEVIEGKSNIRGTIPLNKKDNM